MEKVSLGQAQPRAGLVPKPTEVGSYSRPRPPKRPAAQILIPLHYLLLGQISLRRLASQERFIVSGLAVSASTFALGHTHPCFG